MICETIRPVIRQFMDDLLDEKDYQEIQTHLASCQRCHSYASSVGTISYRVHELGQASLPPDMVSVILHELKKVPAQPDENFEFPSAAETPRKPDGTSLMFWGMAAALVIVSAVAVIALRTAAKTEKGVPALTMAAAPPAHLTERHFHLTLTEKPEVSDLILRLQLTLERDSDRALDFIVPAEKSEQFREAMATLSGTAKEFGDTVSLEGDGQDERVTVFFE